MDEPPEDPGWYFDVFDENGKFLIRAKMVTIRNLLGLTYTAGKLRDEVQFLHIDTHRLDRPTRLTKGRFLHIKLALDDRSNL